MKRHLLQMATILVFGITWLMIYDFTSRMGMDSPRTMSFVPPTQKYPWLFLPWTGIVYFFGGFLSVILPFFWNWSRRNFFFVIASNAIASGIAFITYVLYPLKIVRPHFQGSDFGLHLMRIFTSWDGTTNCFPSFHAIFAVLCALLITRHHLPKILKYSFWILAVSVCCATVTVGQHYVMDVPAGIFTAIFAFYLSRWLLDRPESRITRISRF